MKVLALLALLLASSITHAQPYAALAYTHVKDIGGLGSKSTIVPTVGYAFNEQIAVEASILAPGSARATSLSSSSTATTREDVFSKTSNELRGIRIGVTGRTALTADLSVFGALSLYHMQATIKDSQQTVLFDTTTVPNSILSITETGTARKVTDTVPGLTIGLQYRLSEHLTVFFSHDRIHLSDEMFPGTDSVKTSAIGTRIAF